MVAAACKDIEADRGDLVGDSLRGLAAASPLEAIVLCCGRGCSAVVSWKSCRRENRTYAPEAGRRVS